MFQLKEYFERVRKEESIYNIKVLDIGCHFYDSAVARQMLDFPFKEFIRSAFKEFISWNEMSLFRTITGDGLKDYHRNGSKFIEIDGEKAIFRGMKVNSLGTYGRRKFENLIVIESNMKERVPVKLVYK